MGAAALITGASAGIGRVYALSWPVGASTILFSLPGGKIRLRALAEELKASGFQRRIEVPDMRSARQRCAGAACSKYPGTWTRSRILINNAGFGYLGSFLSTRQKIRATWFSRTVWRRFIWPGSSCLGW